MFSFLSDRTWSILTNAWGWRLIDSETPPVSDGDQVEVYRKWLYSGHVDTHANREGVLVLEGDSYGSLDGAIHRLSPGNLILFDAGTPHSQGYPHKTSHLLHLWFNIFELGVVANFGEKKKSGRYNVVYTTAIQDELVAKIINETWDKMISTTGRLKDAYRLKLMAILSECVSRLLLNDNLSKGDPKERQRREVLDTVIQHIDQSNGAIVSVDDLAEITGYSKFHFLRLFKRRTGMTVGDYMNKCRIDACRRMLEQGMMKKEIAEKLGFSCQSAFSHWYRDKIRGKSS